MKSFMQAVAVAAALAVPAVSFAQSNAPLSGPLNTTAETISQFAERK